MPETRPNPVVPWSSIADFEDEVTMSEYLHAEIAAKTVVALNPARDYDSALRGALVALVLERRRLDGR